jgi:hypothetical protein
MTADAFKKIASSLEEAVSIAIGESPAPSVLVKGHRYVSEAEVKRMLCEAKVAGVQRAIDYLAARGYAAGAHRLKKMKAEMVG